MSRKGVREPIEGDGYAVASLGGLGEGYGFRKIRRGLGAVPGEAVHAEARRFGPQPLPEGGS